jgi:methylenetetrahydrofolate reductase (NADPH)
MANSLIEMNIDISNSYRVLLGPAKLQTLIRYSIECGVGASMKVCKKELRDITKLLLPYEPNEVI